MYHAKMLAYTNQERNPIMITYVCLGVLILFIAIKSAVYMKHRKYTPSSDELDMKLLSLINHESERHD